MELTPAAHRYIASLYEEAISLDLDLEAIRVRLAARGLRKTPAMVRYDLDHVYCYAGYSASHPPEPATCIQLFDKTIDRDPCNRLAKSIHDSSCAV